VPYDPQVGYFTKVSLPSQARRTSRRPPKHLFVLGPIPVDLLAKCRQLHPEAAVVLLRLKATADALGLPVVAGAAVARSLGLHAQAMRRALLALERGDLIDVERAPGRAPRVWFAPGLFEVPR
jgi:hypothetical protein